MTTQFAMPEEELAALVAEVAAGIKEITKKEAQRNANLRKSVPGEEPEGGEGGESAGGPPGGESAPAGDPSASAGGPPGGDPSASAGGPPPDASASAGGPPGGDPAAEGGAPADDGAGAAPSVEDLTQLYSQLPDDQLQAHAVAIQQAVAMRQGAGAGAPPADPSAGAGAPPPAAPPAAPPAGPSPAMKSENEKALELKVESLSKSVESLVSVFTAPMRKSVTRVENGIVYLPYQGGVAQVAPTPMKKSLKEMTRQDIHERLIEVTKDAKLTKSDRDLINDYYDRKVGIEKLEKFFQ